VVRKTITKQMFTKKYADVFKAIPIGAASMSRAP